MPKLFGGREPDGTLFFNLKENACNDCKEYCDKYLPNTDEFHFQYRYMDVWESEVPTEQQRDPTLEDLLAIHPIHRDCVGSWISTCTR